MPPKVNGQVSDATASSYSPGQDSYVSEGIIPKAPDINPFTLINERPAVADGAQALSICKSMQWSGRKLTARAAQIEKKYNGEPPYSTVKLNEMGEGWKANTCYRFLAGRINKTWPRLSNRIESSRYITAATLPAINPDAAKKSDLFRKVVSETVTNWSGWPVFLQGLCLQMVKNGFTFMAYTEQFEWRPRMYRLDKAFVPEGTPIMEQDIPFFSIHEDFEVHEIIQKIQDLEPARAAGWNIEHTVEAINKSCPIPRVITGTIVDSLQWQDLVRELIPSTSFQKGFNVVPTWRLFYKEFDGTVSVRLIAEKTGKEIFYAPSQYRQMSDVVLPFVFEYGNGKVYGSQGVGTILYDTAANIEKARNAINDNARNRNRWQLECEDAAAVTRAKLTVKDNYVIVSGAKLNMGANSLPDVVESSLTLDSANEKWADEIIGTYYPSVSDKAGDESAAAVQINALNAAELRDANLRNFLYQFQLGVAMLSRRLLNPISTDEVAQVAYKTLIDGGLSPEEIAFLANQTPRGTVLEYSEAKTQRTIGFLVGVRGNPAYDQHAVEELIATMSTDSDIAAKILLPVDDQTQTLTGLNQQTGENTTLGTGVPMTPIPNNNHLVHMAVMEGQHDPVTGSYVNDMTKSAVAGNFPVANNYLAHYMAHFDMAAAQGKLKGGDTENQKKQFIAQMKRFIQKAYDTRQQVIQQIQKGIQAGQGGQAGPAPAAPQGATGEANPQGKVPDFNQFSQAAPLTGGVSG